MGLKLLNFSKSFKESFDIWVDILMPEAKSWIAKRNHVGLRSQNEISKQNPERFGIEILYKVISWKIYKKIWEFKSEILKDFEMKFPNISKWSPKRFRIKISKLFETKSCKISKKNLRSEILNIIFQSDVLKISKRNSGDFQSEKWNRIKIVSK